MRVLSSIKSLLFITNSIPKWDSFKDMHRNKPVHIYLGLMGASEKEDYADLQVFH